MISFLFFFGAGIDFCSSPRSFQLLMVFVWCFHVYRELAAPGAEGVGSLVGAGQRETERGLG